MPFAVGKQGDRKQGTPSIGWIRAGSPVDERDAQTAMCCGPDVVAVDAPRADERARSWAVMDSEAVLAVLAELAELVDAGPNPSTTGVLDRLPT